MAAAVAPDARVRDVTPSQLATVVEAFGRAPARTGIFCDFDGTLSEIVADPARARPAPAAVDALTRLGSVYARVGVLSGRPVAFLEQFFDGGVFLAGLYGLEVVDGGIRRDHPQAGAWREVIDDVAACSRDRGPDGMLVENKGLSITLHYRTAPDLGPAVEEWAATQAARSGLTQRSARMSVELHPPIGADKGTALGEAAGDLAAVCYVGDDLGDLPALDRLDEMASSGVEVLRVVVGSDEVAPELAERADIVVDGPSAVVGLLDDLAAAAGLPPRANP